ncbi:L-2-amino-thiazoline-4-carboxylic acid hydrolase [Clostridium sp.]|jgi:hypothetical protein|uniref:L-2-amino-thiazoline-4-carboxylic acid hydrolase n=1 Tax=Clostridium sp. TaxID=1506 RepID=UPI0025868A56|nr:L-2-amino-thiazoline-4-carboxylic acid hydrolase [Clostridium sp.]MDF2505424.1 hypothetical protein [Clostridium sp.]
MAFENNKPSIVNSSVDGMRDISARRAATISNMVETAKNRGLDDTFAREAIVKYGGDNGKDLYNSMNDPSDFKEFASIFGTDHNKDIFEMEIVEKNDEILAIDFHYCPYVTEWLKQGKKPEEIAKLCEITMEGDHAFAKEFNNLEFKLEGTIANGLPVCKLRFNKIN